MSDLLELKILERSCMKTRATISHFMSTKNRRNIKVPEEEFIPGKKRSEVQNDNMRINKVILLIGKRYRRLIK